MHAPSNCAAGDCRLWLANAGGGVWRTNDALAEEPELGPRGLVELAEERFGISVHRRSIERALARQEKKRR